MCPGLRGNAPATWGSLVTALEAQPLPEVEPLNYIPDLASVNTDPTLGKGLCQEESFKRSQATHLPLEDPFVQKKLRVLGSLPTQGLCSFMASQLKMPGLQEACLPGTWMGKAAVDHPSREQNNGSLPPRRLQGAQGSRPPEWPPRSTKAIKEE